MKRIAPLVLLIACLAPAAAVAAEKPGLWEVSTRLDSGLAMPELSPEQRDQMREMGIDLPDPTKDVVSKVCVTDQDAASGASVSAEEMGCRNSPPVVEGNTTTIHAVCSGKIEGTATAKVTYSNDETFSGSWVFTGRGQGQPAKLTNEFRGRWLGADCGNVRPVGK